MKDFDPPGVMELFKQIQALNIGFLRQENSVSYYGAFLQEAHPETVSSLPSLIRINELGFVTQGSQPGRQSSCFSERAYVYGLATLKVYEQLEKLNYSHTITLATRCNQDTNFYPSIPVTCHKFDENCQRSPDASCRCKLLHTPKDRKFFTTSVGAWDRLMAWKDHFASTELAQLKEELLNVVVVDPFWGQHATSTSGLLSRILEVLQKQETKKQEP